MYKIIAIVLLSTQLFSTQIIELTQTQEKDLGIKTELVTKVEQIALPSFNAQVILSQKDTLSISSNLDAVVEDIYVSKFAHVKKGERLLRLKSNALLSLQNEFIEANIEALNASTNLKRDTALHTKGVISEKRLLETKSIYKRAALTQKLRANQLLTNGFTNAMLVKLQETSSVILTQDIFAPKSGVIYSLDINVGEYVQAQKPMMGIYADAKRYLVMNLPAKIAADVRVGDLCEFKNHTARVVALSNMVESASQTVEVRAEIQDASGVLINHIYEAKILKDVSNAQRVSKSALVFVDAKPFVFRKTAQGFEVVNVEILSEEASFYVIQSRLKLGDTIAISSTAALLGAMEEENE